MARFRAVQNEVEYEDAVKLVGKGVTLVLEGANNQPNVCCVLPLPL
jgi:hypothetical protein